MKNKNTAFISTEALKNNYINLREHCRAEAEKEGKNPPMVIGVVKADAYGHGIEIAAKALGDAGCTFFAVSSESEALELREIEAKNGRHPEILILGHILPENVEEMIENDIICTVMSNSGAEALSAAAAKCKKALKVHIKLDTGMNRLGFPTDDGAVAGTVADIARISKDENLKILGMFTHFCCADDEMMAGKTVPGFAESGDFTKRQLKRYLAVANGLRDAGVDVGLHHASNSAGILAFTEAHFEAVRAGIVLYGYNPDGSLGGIVSPVMRLESTVANVHTVKKGEKIGYGATFEAPCDMKVATVMAGYADGISRNYNGCSVRIGGREYPQVGRICMDQFMVDVSAGGDAVQPGDAVVIFGGDRGESMSELAARSATISYEILCRVGKRVPREAE